jgi:hypothetical protein
MIERTKTGEFHFVVNRKLKTKIEKIAIELKLNMSKTIIYMAEKAHPLLNKMHYIYNDENKAVEPVNWDCHIHVYINEDKRFIYNRIKSIHKDNNTYSMAGKIRYLLKIFVRGVELFGLEGFLKVLKKSDKKWSEKLKVINRWEKTKFCTSVRQLSRSILLAVHYDTEYSAVLIKRLI